MIRPNERKYGKQTETAVRAQGSRDSILHGDGVSIVDLVNSKMMRCSTG
jgi:hypothetical protein